MNETLIGKYELRHQIVKDKYFKENMPNLLTWSEKEQIRHLAATAPDEWTPEKIAESFPVTVITVKVIYVMFAQVFVHKEVLILIPYCIFKNRLYGEVTLAFFCYRKY